MLAQPAEALSAASLIQLIWLASPALPVGGFSYSEGLEAAVERAGLATESIAADWLDDQLHLTLARSDLAVIAQAIAAWRQDQPARIRQLNDWVLQTRETSELRAQTEQMGRSLVAWLGNHDGANARHIQACAELGTAFVPFSPLARGALGREIINPETLPEAEFRRKIPRFHGVDWQMNKSKIEDFRAYAHHHGLTPPALALAWVLDQGPHILPIPGTRSADHLADWVAASDITLTAEDRTEIARILPIGWAYGDRYNDDQAGTVERYC